MVDVKNGSGVIYFGVHESQVVDLKRSYLNQWVHNAENFKKQDCYGWMASFLKCKKHKRILDIGCGTANGLLALLRAFDDVSIVSIEENRFCIDLACGKLMNAGYQVTPICRIITNEYPDGCFYISFKHGLLQEYRGITLIEADALLEDDIELSEFLLSIERFDAITVWLLGTHNARCKCLNAWGHKEGDSYTRYSKEKICCAAKLLLNNGGVLHIVDRCSVEKDAKSIMQKYYKRLAREHNFAFDRIDLREYKEISEAVGIAMVNSKLKSRSSDRMSLVSALLIKE